jgi:hypothetical protein
LTAAPTTVREIVRHAKLDVTMTIYAHASLEDKRETLRHLD